MSQPVIGSSISQFPIFQQQQQLPSGSVAPASSLLCSNSDACLTGLAQPISVKNLPVSSVSLFCLSSFSLETLRGSYGSLHNRLRADNLVHILILH